MLYFRQRLSDLCEDLYSHDTALLAFSFMSFIANSVFSSILLLRCRPFGQCGSRPWRGSYFGDLTEKASPLKNAGLAASLGISYSVNRHLRPVFTASFRVSVAMIKETSGKT
jgi:hypothetical protein